MGSTIMTKKNMASNRLIHHGLYLLCLLLLPYFLSAQSCYNNFYNIYDQEAIVTDTSFPRLYIVCPRTIYEIATLDFKGNIREPVTSGVMPPLPIRANMTIRCGDKGSRDSLCWLAGGDIHLDATATRGISDESIEGVSIQGFVFIGARKHSLWATKPGSISFRDCEWRDFVSSEAPIMLDYYDASNPSSKLVTSFEDCEFRNNRYFGMGSMSSLIYGNGAQNTIIVKSSLFEYNDMVFNNTRPDTHSFIIETLGATTIESTCFQNNLVGASDIVVFGNSFTSDTIFATNTSGSLCPLASVFENIEQFDSFSPLCVDASSDSCIRYVTSTPSVAPSGSPTGGLSDAPSTFPTAEPTTTLYPSPLPSFTPSLSPLSTGETREPTLAPYEFVWPEATLTGSSQPGSSSSNTWFLRRAMTAALGLSGLLYYFMTV